MTEPRPTVRSPAPSDGPAVGLRGPIEIAPRIWWVSNLMTDDQFQSHSYLVEAGNQSVLIDPGSAITIDGVIENVRQVLDLNSVRWVVCHHADPDVCSGLARLDDLVHPDARVVTEWRAAALLRHYGSRLATYLIEDHEWAIDLEEGRRLEFTLTPYLHFPGALSSYETSTAVMFTCDLFGGFSDASSLWATDPASTFELMRSFHEHYMPSGDILRAGLDNLRHRWPHATVIAPQHGRVIPAPMISEMFERLSNLECGIFRLAENDIHLATLLAAAALERDLARAILSTSDLPELAERATRLIGEHLAVERIEAYVLSDTEGVLRFAPDERYEGKPIASMPIETAAPFLDLPSDDATPAIRVYLVLADDQPLPREFARAMVQLSQPIKVALVEHLARRSADRDRARILAQSLTDPLTDLANRRALADTHLANDPSAILMIDVDRFKSINDKFGHDVGDDALRQVATVIRANIRSRSDLGVRYGGDEFLVVLREADEAHALDVAERIRRQVERVPATGRLAPTRATLTVSIGATLHESHQDLGLSIAHADEALYRSKAAGRNRVSATWAPSDNAVTR